MSRRDLQVVSLLFQRRGRLSFHGDVGEGEPRFLGVDHRIATKQLMYLLDIDEIAARRRETVLLLVSVDDWRIPRLR